MTKSLTVSEYTTGRGESQDVPWEVPPIVGELEAVFRELPAEELLRKLKGSRRRGPNGYNPFVYNRRTSAERLFGRLKGHRKLNHIRVRGIRKITVHCLMSVIVFQAQVLATGNGGLVRKVA